MVEVHRGDRNRNRKERRWLCPVLEADETHMHAGGDVLLSFVTRRTQVQNVGRAGAAQHAGGRESGGQLVLGGRLLHGREEHAQQQRRACICRQRGGAQADAWHTGKSGACRRAQEGKGRA